MGGCIFSRPIPNEEKKAIVQRKNEHEARLVDIALANNDDGNNKNYESLQENEANRVTAWINSYMNDAVDTLHSCTEVVPPAPAPVRDILLADGDVTDHIRCVVAVLQILQRPSQEECKQKYLYSFPERVPAVGALVQISAEQRGDQRNPYALRAFRICHLARLESRKGGADPACSVRDVAHALQAYIAYITYIDRECTV